MHERLRAVAIAALHSTWITGFAITCGVEVVKALHAPVWVGFVVVNIIAPALRGTLAAIQKGPAQ